MEQNISFNIAGIELLEYAIISPNKAIPNNISYQFDLNIEHRTNIEQKLVFVVVTVRVLSEDVDLASAKISCIYDIANLEEFLSDKKVTLPDEFIVALNSISLSTVRGVIFTLFRGTLIHNVILPIVDPKGFIKK